MSRNKDIEFLHYFTGLPYSVCRQRMKKCSWDLWRAIGIDFHYGESRIKDFHLMALGLIYPYIPKGEVIHD